MRTAYLQRQEFACVAVAAAAAAAVGYRGRLSHQPARVLRQNRHHLVKSQRPPAWEDESAESQRERRTRP